MSETSLKFGPEWLRVLSHGNLSSPPSSPGPIKFKLADYRYGREEMIQLYAKDIPPPDGLHNLGALYIDRNQDPLAFLPMNGEEQQIWQRSGSSDQVLRGPGRAPINGVGRGRGGSVERGRGRGRGVGAPYYNRGLSYDEECEIRGTREAGPPGMPVRNKNYERSQSSGDSRVWGNERNPMERPPTGIGEERSGAVSPKKGRATIENWRSRGVPEEKGDSWRGVRNDKWGNRIGGWRERELDGDWEEGRSEASTRMRNSTRSWDTEREKDGHRRQWEEDNLPEWVTENAEDKGGSFDATGAFHAPGSSDEEEEDECDRDGEREEEGEEDAKKELSNQHHEEISKSKSEIDTSEDPPFTSSLKDGSVEKSNGLVESSNKLPKPVEPKEQHNSIRENSVAHHADAPVMNGVLSEEERIALCTSPAKKEKKKKPNITTSPPPASPSALHISVPETSSTILTSSSSVPIAVTTHTRTTHPIHALNSSLNQAISTNSILQPSSSVHVNMHVDRLEEKLPQMEEDNLQHMQSAADDLVARLVEDDEPRMRIHQPPPGGFLPVDPISHPSPEDQWYYTDPQGDIQGPFSSADMNAWYKTGYFRSTLLLRRQCDDKFAQLGDLMKVFGRVPFIPGPPVPPLKVSELLNAQKVQAERERYEMMQAQAQLLQKQMYQQQNSLRQQQQQQQQQQQHVINSMQGMEEWNHLNSSQQHQLYMQQMMGIPPIVPSSMPVSLHNSVVTSTATTNGHQPPSNAELRSSLSSSNTPPLSQHPDPIQAFVAQMATSASSNITSASETPLVQPPPSNSPIGGENPLQKLLLQLQRGTQSGVGGGLATPGANPLISGHQPPSSLGTIPTPSLGLEKSPDQFDAIQSLMSQLTKMQIQTPDTMQQEDPRIREEEQKRIEEERRQFEEQKRAEEERIKLQELRLQEERMKEEGRRRELEAKNQRLEEELRRIQEEQMRRKREEENKMREAENKRKMEQKNTEASKREEEHKRQQQQLKQKQKQEEEARRKEEARKMEEARKAEEEAKKKEEQRIREEQQQKIKEEKKKEEEERKRKKEEKERQQQIQVQEEMRRIALEEERKRMQQLAEEERKKQQQEEQVKQRQQKKVAAMHEQAKATPPAWNNTPAVQEKNDAPSLAEIQKTQEIKERKEREAEAQREAQRLKEAQRQAAEEKKKQETNLKWASRVSQNTKGNSKPAVGQPPEPPVKSLIEIQKEEEKEMKKRKQKEMADRASALSHLPLNAAGVWGSAAQSLSWANRASSGAAPVITISSPQVSQPAWGSSGTTAWSTIAQSNISTASSGWNTETTTYNQNTNQNMGGFWESPDNVKYGSGKGAQSGIAGASNSNRSPPKASTANHSGNTKSAAGPQAVNSNNKVNKKKNKDENETVKRLFVDNITPPDNFTQWCKTSLAAMKITVGIDIPTFVGFLADVESPYEVHDYIRSYLGDSKEVKEFAKQYLERRSKARDAQKERHEEDNILAPAPAVNPASNVDFQEVKTRLKRGRKKMQKVDSSILGFNSGALERVDVDDE